MPLKNMFDHPLSLEGIYPSYNDYFHSKMQDKKHCQRHNGPELSIAYQSNFIGHITNSYANLDQTSSESLPSTNFKISLNHQHFEFRQNLNLKILTKPTFRISTKIKLYNQNQAPAAK